MNKKVTSLLLVFVMLFGIMAPAGPVLAADSNEFVITPDKSEAYPGDTITYTVVLGPIANFQSANFTLVIPEGLTFVSGATPEGLKELTGATEAGFENSTLTFYHGGLGAYTSSSDTVLMTFACTVNSDALGNYQIDIMDDWDFADSNYTSYSDMVINTAASKVTVVQKPVAATGISLNKETLTLKVGESETLIATVAPQNTTDTVAWTSSNENVATVDASGKVTAVAEGNATITVKAGDVSATCTVIAECAHINTTEHPANASTCTEQGNGAYTTCDDCGDVISGSAEKLPLDPANHVDTTTYPAETGSCIDPGHAEYSFCNDCESIISGSDSPITGPHGNYVEKVEERYLKSAADCDDAAVYYKSCELCGEAHATETFTYGDALGHEYSDATCTTPKTCKVCGDTDGDALGHSYATVWSKGEDGHRHECSACGDKIDFAAHDYGTAGDSCVICEYERSHVHRLTLVPGVDATCTVDGNKAYYTCSGCENWFEDGSGSVVISDKTSVVISALGHDLSDATCTEAAACQREGCGHIEGTALGHSFTNYVSNNDATCTADGTKTATCDRCDATDTVADVGSAKGHDYTDATCTAPKTCKVCGATEGDALGHSFTNYVSNNDATCTADGTKTATCDRCDATDTVADAGSAKGHDYAEATCTAPKTCKVCGATEGEALGHNHATVWSKGEDGHWHECSVCGDKADFAAHDYSTEGDTCLICEYERAHVHRLILVPGVDATCTEAGSKAYYTCSGCEDWFEDASGTVVIVDKISVAIAALGHDLSDATCTEASYCQREGCDYTEGSALGHVEVTDEAKAPTCTEDGLTEGSHCSVCGEVIVAQEVVEAFGHTEVIDEAKTPTCTESGLTEGKHCSVCGEVIVAQEVVSALGHTWSDWTEIKAPTEDEKGEETRACSVCGEVENRPVAELGHICQLHLTVVEAKEATCTAEGNIAHYVCECGKYYADATASKELNKEDIVIPMVEHELGEFVVTKEPTFTEKGEESAECKVCGYIEVREIPVMEIKLDVQVGGITEVPDELKEAGLETPEEVNETLTQGIITANDEIEKDNVAHYDVTFVYSNDGGKTWMEADEEHWPESGKLTIELPYPEGTDSSYTFVVAHMFTSDAFGKTPGDVEYPVVVKTKTGIRFEVTGLSPISVGWKAPETQEEAADTNNPQTGDSRMIDLWIGLMCVGACGIVAAITYKKKRTAN